HTAPPPQTHTQTRGRARERARPPKAHAYRQASAGARDGVKGQSRTLAARAPLHALVRRVFRFTDCMPEPPQEGKFPRTPPTSKLSSNLGRKRVQQNLRMVDVVAFRQ